MLVAWFQCRKWSCLICPLLNLGTRLPLCTSCSLFLSRWILHLSRTFYKILFTSTILRHSWSSLRNRQKCFLDGCRLRSQLLPPIILLCTHLPLWPSSLEAASTLDNGSRSLLPAMMNHYLRLIHHIGLFSRAFDATTNGV